MSGTGSSQQSKFTEVLREEVVDPVNKSSLAICNVKISCHFSNETVTVIECGKRCQNICLLG